MSILKSGSWVSVGSIFLLFAAGVVALAAGAGLKAQSGAQSSQAAQEQALIRSVEGADLYRAYCASCHGKEGKGDGPAAPALKATVPDLTAIARNNDGKFPVARVQRIIMGEGMIVSHGSREMPVWGPIFHQIENDVDRGNVRLDNLVKYLQSIQTFKTAEAKPAGKPSAQVVPTGEKLYRQNCAACHGNDLKGNGPAPAPFKDVPPDLTLLAQSHGGKYPDEFVTEVLRYGVLIPAHGPPEMPIWGADFKAKDQLTSAQVTQRIASLNDYIKSLQAK